YMPPTFQRRADGSESPRLDVMSENNGLIMMRAGRQIDVVTKIPLPGFVLVNYDRNWGAEIDFDPSLDEYFGVTTNKQQITITEGMWEMLKQNGLFSALKGLRERLKDDKKKDEVAEQPEEKIAAKIAAETQKLRVRKGVRPTPEK